MHMNMRMCISDMICMKTQRGEVPTSLDRVFSVARILHTRHILPPSEIDLGLFWADFTDLEGKYLFHRIG